MGYFFRPRFPNGDYLYANHSLFLALAKQMDVKKNKYSFSGPIGGRDKEFAHWRFWGYFIHAEHYKDFIDKLFYVMKDPSCEDEYNGETIWRRRFNKKIYDGNMRGEGFNHTFIDGYTVPEINEAFAMLKHLVQTDTTIDWDEQEDFFADLKQSLKYIMLSKWEDYEAY